MRLSSSWAYAFATLAAASSDQGSQDCAVASGSYENIAYRYHAHSKNCATMSQAGAIKDELHRVPQELGLDKIPSSKCIKFDGGGLWEGWSLCGRLGEVRVTQYWGPRVEVGKGESRSDL